MVALVKTLEGRESGLALRRSHPWTTSVDHPDQHYCDFRAHPELIPLMLHDFKPWETYPAIRSFYELVAAINGPTSVLESNDCVFTGPEANTDAGFGRLKSEGRLSLLFRDLRVNTNERAVLRLIEAIHLRLQPLNPELAWAAVGTTRLRVEFRDLPLGAREGWQVLLSFWAWGDDEPEVFANLACCIAALRTTLETPSL